MVSSKLLYFLLVVISSLISTKINSTLLGVCSVVRLSILLINYNLNILLHMRKPVHIFLWSVLISVLIFLIMSKYMVFN